MINLAIDLKPLREYPDYRKMFFGQLVSFVGSQITYVALPWQLYQLTHSTFQVGLLGVFQLIPLIVVGLWGGALADRVERRRICVISEILLALCNVALIVMTLRNQITVYAIYALGALMVSFNAIHRPAFSSMIPQIVKKKDLSRVSPLNSFISTFGMITGPAIGGLLLAHAGIVWTYVIDMLTYLFVIAMMIQLPRFEVQAVDKKVSSLQSIKEGMNYALTRRDLWGTYIVDIIAMTFAFPNPLFPMLAASFAGAEKLGWYYSATAIGALMATLTSGWTLHQKSHGKIITFAASGWGVGIIFFGLSLQYFYLSLIFLLLAGWSDMISGIFRGTMWNETIPNEKRGRLASVEMLSYASGPLIGQVFMGSLSDMFGASKGLIIGGTCAALGCLCIGKIISPFWNYRATTYDG
ncbi:MAG: MFS transporter [Bacteriovoracaceae bacterium]|nr:MFS transporter [Bacteriovoracaceae bacterium]